MKAIILSVLAVLVTWGLLVGVLFVFGFGVIWGIVGIVILGVASSSLFGKAATSANNFLTKLIARVVAPVTAAVGVLAILLGFFLGGAWF